MKATQKTTPFLFIKVVLKNENEKLALYCGFVNGAPDEMCWIGMEGGIKAQIYVGYIIYCVIVKTRERRRS